MTSKDEIGQLTATFNQMQQQLQRVDIARKEFIATASHELRTPIFSLGGFVELLQDEDLDEDTRREFLETMGEQVERLQKLSVDLLDLSRLDSGSRRAAHRAGRPRGAHALGGRRVPPAAHRARHRRSMLRRPGGGPERALRPGTGRSDHAYPARQRPPAHAGGHGRDRERIPLQRRRRAHGGGQRPRPAGRRAREGLRALLHGRRRRAAPGSAWRSHASSRSGWTDGWCSRPSAT